MKKINISKKISVCLILISLTTFTSANSFGQECKQKAEGWNPPSAGPIVTWTAPVVCKGSLVVQPFFFYNYIRGIFNGESHYKHFRDGGRVSEFQEMLFLQYGLTDRFEISAQGMYQQTMVRQDGASVTASGFNDTYLFLRYCVLDETDWLPTTTAVFQLKFPTGKYQKADPAKLGADIMTAYTGGGAYEEACGLNFTKKIKPFIFHADFAFGFPNPVAVDGVNTKYGSFFNYDGAIEYFFWDHFNLLVEASGLVQGDTRENGYLTPSTAGMYLNLIAGLGWSDSKIQMLVAYQRTVAGTNANVNDSVIATFVYTF